MSFESIYVFSRHHQFTGKGSPSYFILVKLFWEPSIPPDLNQFNSVRLCADLLFFFVFFLPLTPLHFFLPLSLMDWCQDNIKAVLIPWHGIPVVLFTFSILKQGKCLHGGCTWGQAFSVWLMSGNGALTTLCNVDGCHLILLNSPPALVVSCVTLLLHAGIIVAVTRFSKRRFCMNKSARVSTECVCVCVCGFVDIQGSCC